MAHLGARGLPRKEVYRRAVEMATVHARLPSILQEVYTKCVHSGYRASCKTRGSLRFGYCVHKMGHLLCLRKLIYFEVLVDHIQRF